MQNQRELSHLLIRIIDLQDPTAERHSKGVATLSAELASRINMNAGEQQVLQHAAKLHDIGKVAISDSVINRPSRLTRAEYQMVQQHTVLGYQLLEPMKINSVITAAILSHHENFDGSGSPEGSKGESIHLSARIIRIADFFDALTSHHSYRDNVFYNPADVLDVLRENRNCFDPTLFDEFIEMIGDKL